VIRKRQTKKVRFKLQKDKVKSKEKMKLIKVLNWYLKKMFGSQKANDGLPFF